MKVRRHHFVGDLLVVTDESLPESGGQVVARYNEKHGSLSLTKHGKGRGREVRSELKEFQRGELIPVGTRVAAQYPNASWGIGVVTDADLDATTVGQSGRKQRRKTYVVEREDGTVGHFHIGQVAPVEDLPAADAAEGTPKC